MLKHHNFVSFFSTILLYLGIGTLFFYLQHIYIGTEQKPQEKIISFSLSEYEPEIIPPIEEPIIEPIEKIEKPVVEEELIVEEPEPPVIEEVIPEPIVEKIVPKPLPIVKKKIIKKPVKKKLKKKVKKKKRKKTVLKKRVKKKTSQKIASQKKPSRKKVSHKKQASPAKKNRFLAQLRGKIDRYKTYPRIAQKRGMQGTVKVKFTILANGQVGNITMSGKKVFYSSARNAVKKAFPIQAKNAPMSLPTIVNLTLRYQMR